MTGDAPIEVDPREAQGLVRDGDAVFVDVRTDDELPEGMIAGATHIELAELSARAGELPDRPLVFYCHTGVRSLMAAQALRGAGHEAYSLAGGVVAWASDGLELVAP
jgi:rhodanese-related sulfurtransferase